MSKIQHTKRYTHNSKELNKYLGKKVKITFFDNDIEIGILKKQQFPYSKHPYQINNLVFCKSHVKKIEVQNG